MAGEVGSAASSLLALARRLAFEPIVIGPLLFILTKGPDNIRRTIFRTFPSLANPRNASVLVQTLKWLFGLGLASKVNKTLNAWAINHWRWRKQGVKWDFANRKEVAIVTGGCSGIGHLVVKGLAGKMKIVVLDVQEMPADLQGRAGVSFYRCDITSPSAVSLTAASIRSEVGSPSILINNAGIATSHTILDTSEEYLEKIFRVNLLSHFTLIKEFLPAMLDQSKGHIVSVASMASYYSVPNLADYCCTKAGVLALHETLNQELKHRYVNGRAIQTSIIHPLWARTPLIKDWEAALVASKVAIMSPDSIADAMVRQVLNGESGQIYVPSTAELAAGVRGWPNWLQEFLRDGQAGAKSS